MGLITEVVTIDEMSCFVSHHRFIISYAAFPAVGAWLYAMFTAVVGSCIPSVTLSILGSKDKERMGKQHKKTKKMNIMMTRNLEIACERILVRSIGGTYGTSNHMDS